MNILFLCTHNSARSILSEALLNHLSKAIGAGQFKAYSAGSSPRENQQPNPLAIQVLRNAGIDTSYLSSKSWDVFAASDAPKMDLVVTVCDNAAAEVCPFFPSSGAGKPIKAHWGYADPSLVEGTLDVRLQAFKNTMGLIETRLKAFIANGHI
jgi:protein-tyrosine-phosphatase